MLQIFLSTEPFWTWAQTKIRFSGGVWLCDRYPGQTKCTNSKDSRGWSSNRSSPPTLGAMNLKLYSSRSPIPDLLNTNVVCYQFERGWYSFCCHRCCHGMFFSLMKLYAKNGHHCYPPHLFPRLPVLWSCLDRRPIICGLSRVSTTSNHKSFTARRIAMLKKMMLFRMRTLVKLMTVMTPLPHIRLKSVSSLRSARIGSNLFSAPRLEQDGSRGS